MNWSREDDFLEAINRRDFLIQSCSLLAGMSLLPYMGWSEGSIKAETIDKTKVGVIRSSNRLEAAERAFNLMSLPDVNGDSVLIKPNFNTADPAPGSTHNDTLRAIIEKLKEAGAAEIYIGERSGPPDTEEVMKKKGIFELAEELNVEVINFDQLSEEELIHFQHEDLSWQDGFHIPKILRQVDHILAAGCLKTHQFGGQFTMALKLAVGIIPRAGTAYMSELHGSQRMRDLIAEITLAYEPSLYLIDGVEAFVDGGPAAGERVQADVTLVGNDPVAIDAVGVAILKELGSKDVIMNTPIFELEQLARAAEIGLGVESAEQIKLISDDSAGRKYISALEPYLEGAKS